MRHRNFGGASSPAARRSYAMLRHHGGRVGVGVIGVIYVKTAARALEQQMSPVSDLKDILKPLRDAVETGCAARVAFSRELPFLTVFT